MLIDNLEFNSTTNVFPLEQALGSRSGILTEPLFRLWGQDPEVTTVEFTTIDDFFASENLKRIDFIKIDVDGFDLEVLWGAEQTLARQSPIVLVEINQALATRGHSASQVLDWMLTQRYSKVLVLDRDNYLFMKDWTLGDPWPTSLTLTVDRRDPLRLDNLEIEASDQSSLDFDLVLHNSAKRGIDGNVSIDSAAWAYAASISGESFHSRGDGGVVVDLSVHEGTLGVFLSDRTGSEMLTRETMLDSGFGFARFPLQGKSFNLVLRKTTDAPLNFTIRSIRLGRLLVVDSDPAPMNSLTIPEFAKLLHQPVGDAWAEHPLAAIQSMTVEELGQSQSWVLPPPSTDAPTDPESFVMERDDAPVLQWLYRCISPNRHFEFGTWEGFGTTLCLRACSAQVWTIDLPVEESHLDRPSYPISREPDHKDTPRPSASRSEHIGWMYRSAGLEGRVTQLTGDSTTHDFSEFRDLTFDTAFIDGGHQRHVVQADLQTAYALVDKKGWIIWHDFTLDQTVLKHHGACRGVIAAVADRLSSLTETHEVIWLQDTMLLLAVPKSNHKMTPGTNKDLA